MCSSVTLFEGQFLAVGGFRDGSPKCPGLHGQRHLREPETAAGREVACQVACVEMGSTEGIKVGR